MGGRRAAWWRAVAPAWWCAAALAAGCASGAPAGTVEMTVWPPASAAYTRFVEAARDGWWRGAGEATVEVWVCAVPADTTAPDYGALPLRLTMEPEALAEAVAPLGAYFDELSNGRYRPVFRGGGTVTLDEDDGPAACAAATADAAGQDADVVLAVADAEHVAGLPGGRGSGGEPCPGTPPCPVGQSRRVAYVAANDFHPQWGSAPPLDLVAHELGHTLGMVHSAYDPSAAQPYLSELDVMSNSAAAREAQPERRDAPGVPAVQRLLAGWLDEAGVVGVPAEGGAARLAPSSALAATRLLVLPVGDASFLTVELITATGMQAHLPHDGVAVHLVTPADGAIEVVAVHGVPSTTLLRPGADVTAHGWRLQIGDGWRVLAAPQSG